MKKTGLSTALLLVFAAAGAQDTSPTDSLLCRVYEDDQGVRRELPAAYSSGVPQDSLMVIVARMLEIDRKNQRTVLGLLDDCGWPEGLSPDADQAIFPVIDHAELPDQRKYLPLVGKDGVNVIWDPCLSVEELQAKMGS